LLTQVRTFFRVELVRILALTAAGKRRGAGGVVTRLETPIVGLEPDGLAVLSDSLIELALACQGEAEVDVGFGGILLESDGLAEFGNGLVELAPAEQGSAEVDVGLGEILLESDDLAVFLDGLIDLTLVAQSDAEVDAGLREIRVQ
jgi:hypothetical protein